MPVVLMKLTKSSDSDMETIRTSRSTEDDWPGTSIEYEKSCYGQKIPYCNFISCFEKSEDTQKSCDVSKLSEIFGGLFFAKQAVPQQTQVQKKVDEFYALKSGQIRARINKSDEFVLLKAAHRLLVIDAESSAPQCIQIRDIVQVLRHDITKSVSLFYRPSDTDLVCIHAEFESSLDSQLFCKWIRKCLRSLQKRLIVVEKRNKLQTTPSLRQNQDETKQRGVSLSYPVLK